jgi:hypothetical protein
MNHALPKSEYTQRSSSQQIIPVAIVASPATTSAIVATAQPAEDDVEQQQQQQQQQTIGLTTAFRIQTTLIAELERAIASESDPAERARLERMRREALAHATALIGRAVAETMRQQEVLSAEVGDAVRIAMRVQLQRMCLIVAIIGAAITLAVFATLSFGKDE